MKLNNNITIYSSAILIMLILWTVGLFYFTSSLQIAPKLSDKEVDAIVVFTGGSNRIDEGFNLLDKKAAKKLFISGVYKGIDTTQLLNRWRKEDQNHLDCCVVLGFEAVNTIQNVKETAKWLKDEKYKSIYLVTSNYHMPRALLEFKRRLPEIEVHPYPIIPQKVNMDSWWDNRTNFVIISKEYTKYIIVKILSLLLH